jgi:hypothetical protein
MNDKMVSFSDMQLIRGVIILMNALSMVSVRTRDELLLSLRDRIRSNKFDVSKSQSIPLFC